MIFFSGTTTKMRCWRRKGRRRNLLLPCLFSLVLFFMQFNFVEVLNMKWGSTLCCSLAGESTAKRGRKVWNGMASALSNCKNVFFCGNRSTKLGLFIIMSEPHDNNTILNIFFKKKILGHVTCNRIYCALCFKTAAVRDPLTYYFILEVNHRSVENEAK